jgi:anti-anti-sigma factor
VNGICSERRIESEDSAEPVAAVGDPPTEQKNRYCGTDGPPKREQQVGDKTKDAEYHPEDFALHGTSLAPLRGEERACIEFVVYCDRRVKGELMAQSQADGTRGFRVECFEVDGVLVAECEGKLTLEQTPVLKQALKDKIGGYKRIVIDLKGVPMIDSSGLGTIVGLYVSSRTRGCEFQLANASEQIRQLFSMSNLLSLFEAAGRHHGKTI